MRGCSAPELPPRGSVGTARRSTWHRDAVSPCLPTPRGLDGRSCRDTVSPSSGTALGVSHVLLCFWF